MDERWIIFLMIGAGMFWWQYGMFERHPDIEKEKTKDAKSFTAEGSPKEILKIITQYVQSQTFYQIEHFDEENSKIILRTGLNMDMDPAFYTVFAEEYNTQKTTINVDAEFQHNSELYEGARDKCITDLQVAIFSKQET